ncbi:hypothetical protein [Luteibacter pinisoli]|uniref:hypothetical protein n=1 Tax=Luteibacter pinisoli TaxID=2589080 RepID=UPI001B86554B|nr:hypothetical protein [Luteibacter pinisoli]
MPQALVAGVVGWLVASRLRETPVVACLVAGSFFLYYALTHWQHTRLILDPVAGIDVAAESLAVPAGFLLAYFLRRRLVRGARDTSVVRLAIALAAVTLVELYVLRYINGWLFTGLSDTPEMLAPLWVSLGQAVTYLVAGYSARRWAWLTPVDATLMVCYACFFHVELWLWTASYTPTFLAVAVVWLPVVVMPPAFALGWWSAHRSRVAT